MTETEWKLRKEICALKRALYEAQAQVLQLCHDVVAKENADLGTEYVSPPAPVTAPE